MRNIFIVLKHEYLQRVRKKSFIIMTLLGPLLVGLFYGGIAYVSMSQMSSKDNQKVGVIDPANHLNQHIDSQSLFTFDFIQAPKQAQKALNDGQLDVLLSIDSLKRDSIQITSKSSLSITDKQSLSKIVSEQYFNNALYTLGLNQNELDSLKPSIHIKDQLSNGKSSATEIKSGIGYLGAFIIYLFIFMYGVMIMKSVSDEKSNRIVEIIISAVKPFELMMGKILGVALVGLTQFIAWITLSGLLLTVLGIALGSSEIGHTATQSSQAIGDTILNQLSALNYPKIIFGFAAYFIGGYLLYASLFAAIGSAVDNDTETQQFMFPVSMPLIFGLVIAQVAVINNPNSDLAVWCSMIPFTSPVVMMVRLPFDIAWSEIILSLSCLLACFILIVWLAARIYRIGILSYGQKASYKQLFKWLMMKQ